MVDSPPRAMPKIGPDMARLYAPAALTVLAFLWLFHNAIAYMAQHWREDPTFSHGWIVAPAAIIIAWVKRDDWLGTPARPALSGYGVIAAGLFIMLLGAWSDVQFFMFIAMLVVVAGVIVALGGWTWMKKLAFPYAFLFFMVPWPEPVVSKVTFPMQLFTSAYSSALASIIGVPVKQDGVNLYLTGHVKASFEVAAACSGMRSLVALLCLAAGFAYFTDAALWKRWAIFLLGFPMAFTANVLRVFAILCVGQWINPKLAAGLFHDWSSPVLFLINTMGLMALRNAMMRPPKAVAAPGMIAPDTTGLDMTGPDLDAPTMAAPLAPARTEDDDAY